MYENEYGDYEWNEIYKSVEDYHKTFMFTKEAQ